MTCFAGSIWLVLLCFVLDGFFCFGFATVVDLGCLYGWFGGIRALIAVGLISVC